MNNNNAEYNSFMIKLALKVKEFQDDWEKLSNENKVKFANETSLFLEQYNIAVTANDILKMVKGH